MSKKINLVICLLILLISLNIHFQIKDSTALTNAEEPVNFEISANTESKKLFINMQIDKGWDVYASTGNQYNFQINLKGNDNLLDYNIHFPEPDKVERRQNEHREIDLIYRNQKQIDIDLELSNPNKPTNLELKLSYAACNGTICAIFNKEIDYIFNTSNSISTLNNSSSNSLILELLLMILIGFGGGLMLNFMPCVLPVISIKILSFIKGNNQKSNTKINLLLTAAGIISTFIILSIIILSLKKIGTSIGWGIHFHEPIFLMILFMVLMIFSASLWGGLESRFKLFQAVIGRLTDISNSKTAYISSFISGVLSTLLATPCTAPLISSSVAFALVQEQPYVIIIIYLAIGFGMSTPYFLMIMTPKLLYLFPKPGAWTLLIKKIGSGILALTALWILYVISKQVNMTTFGIFVIATTSVASILLLIVKKRKFLLILLLSFLISSSVFFLINISNIIKSDNNNLYPYSENNLTYNLDQDRIVLVDITASWCVNCQYNKYVVFEKDSVKNFLQEHKIITLIGDYTNKSDQIKAFLEKHKRFGIPLNVLYCKAFPEGKVLPEILSEQTLLDDLKKCLITNRY